MDYKPLPVGVDNFEKLVTREYYFIDKTWLIKELLDKKGDVNLFTRPRRFGKTLNMSMLQYFFEDMYTEEGKKQDNTHLFENMRIMQAGEKYLAHMGKYPVINLTFKDAKQPDFELAYSAMKWQIAGEYQRHKFILQDERLAEEKEEYPRSYWANTSSNSIVRRLVEMADDSVKGELENLIDGGTVEKPIHEDITYGEVYENMDNLWNFMFFTGYLKKVDERMGEDDTHYLTLMIPNREVRYIFHEKIMAWFEKKMKERDLTALHTALVNKDTARLEEELTDILYETISSFDESENYYHGLVAGLLSGMKGYRTKSNRETGKGRCDLFVKPVSRRKEAFIVEFKTTKKMKEIEAKAEEALQQIEEKHYALELEEDGYDIYCSYGIAFCGKDCCVRLR